jgi:hypothetical protein
VNVVASVETFISGTSLEIVKNVTSTPATIVLLNSDAISAIKENTALTALMDIPAMLDAEKRSAMTAGCSLLAKCAIREGASIAWRTSPSATATKGAFAPSAETHSGARSVKKSSAMTASCLVFAKYARREDASIAWTSSSVTSAKRASAQSAETDSGAKSVKKGSALNVRPFSNVNVVPPSAWIVMSPKRRINGSATTKLARRTLQSPPNQAHLTPRPSKTEQRYRIGKRSDLCGGRASHETAFFTTLLRPMIKIRYNSI